MISQVGNRDIVFQRFRSWSPSPLTVASIFLLFPLFLFLVLGIPHPAVNTRDVALYQPFRNALKLPNQSVRLPTLTFHFMGRRGQEGQQNPVRLLYILRLRPSAQSLSSSHLTFFAPTSRKMRARQWTYTILTPMSGKPRYTMASGLLPFRQAVFPAVTSREP
jgi:hypothetical protein